MKVTLKRTICGMSGRQELLKVNDEGWGGEERLQPFLELLWIVDEQLVQRLLGFLPDMSL